ncbi:hypothetical protein [Myxococcus qinghaiensis]|nr:hypothetical protein [Myxococcus qinghaiensis]MCP3167517.1 hypothetical protein [Myxococcus qinghaiensis]
MMEKKTTEVAPEADGAEPGGRRRHYSAEAKLWMLSEAESHGSSGTP